MNKTHSSKHRGKILIILIVCGQNFVDEMKNVWKQGLMEVLVHSTCTDLRWTFSGKAMLDVSWYMEME